MRRGDLCLCAVLLLAGCATSALDRAPPRPDRPWAPAIAPGGEILSGETAAEGASGYVLPANPALGAVPAAPSLDAGHPYSLAELIDLAESSNPETRIAWDNARNAALASGIAESAWLPRLTASVIAGYQVSHGRNAAFGFSLPGSNSATGVISALSAEWLLFDFGQRDAVVEAARQTSLISNIAFTAAHQQLIHAVSLAFYRNAAAQARIAIAEKSLRNAIDVQAAAEARFKHGIGTVIEVSQARQATAQARLADVQAKGAAEDSYLALLGAIGISPLTRIRIADVSRRPLSAAMADPADRVVSQALSRRPDMLSAYAAQKASAANVRAAEADFLPKLFLSTTGSYSSAGLGVTALPPIGQQPPTLNLSGSQLGATVIAGVTIPIYDGGVREAVLGQARANADKAGAVMERTRTDAVREIVGAQSALRTSLAAHDAARALAAAAQTTFDAALAAYRNGVGSITDMTLAETQLLQAQYAATDSYSAALSAAATLAFATGALGAAPE